MPKYGVIHPSPSQFFIRKSAKAVVASFLASVASESTIMALSIGRTLKSSKIGAPRFSTRLTRTKTSYKVRFQHSNLLPCFLTCF